MWQKWGCDIEEDTEQKKSVSPSLLGSAPPTDPSPLSSSPCSSPATPCTCAPPTDPSPLSSSPCSSPATPCTCPRCSLSTASTSASPAMHLGEPKNPPSGGTRQSLSPPLRPTSPTRSGEIRSCLSGDAPEASWADRTRSFLSGAAPEASWADRTRSCLSGAAPEASCADPTRSCQPSGAAPETCWAPASPPWPQPTAMMLAESACLSARSHRCHWRAAIDGAAPAASWRSSARTSTCACPGSRRRASSPGCHRTAGRAVGSLAEAAAVLAHEE